MEVSTPKAKNRLTELLRIAAPGEPMGITHQDPFDRVLIAQAIVERLSVVTANSKIARYASPAQRVIVSRPQRSLLNG